MECGDAHVEETGVFVMAGRCFANEHLWSEADVERLRAEWATGKSMSEIGAILNLSKNAVCGKVHRLKLPCRPSPIDRSGKGRQPRSRKGAVKRAPQRTLAPLASTRVTVVVDNTRPAPVETPRYSGELCCYPIGEPGSKSFRYCDKKAKWGSPYCTECHRICYVPAPKREIYA